MPPPRTLRPAVLTRVQQYIAAHLDEALPLVQLAGVARMSPWYFAHLFTHATGLPPRRYIIAQRLRQAAYLLTATPVPLAAIALTVGFCNPSALGLAFRRHYGMTPGQYRNRMAYEREGERDVEQR